MSGEWGPWVEHDGTGCPCPGEWVQVEGEGINGEIFRGEGFCELGGPSWDWTKFGQPAGIGCHWAKILRYRIRKPRGLATFLDMIAGVAASTEREQA